MKTNDLRQPGRHKPLIINTLQKFNFNFKLYNFLVFVYYLVVLYLAYVYLRGSDVYLGGSVRNGRVSESKGYNRKQQSV